MRSCARALWVLPILLFAASASATVRTGTCIGIDLLNSMVYAGTNQGVIYGVLLPLP